jgi:hypothetical protein
MKKLILLLVIAVAVMTGCKSKTKNELLTSDEWILYHCTSPDNKETVYTEKERKLAFNFNVDGTAKIYADTLTYPEEYKWKWYDDNFRTINFDSRFKFYNSFHVEIIDLSEDYLSVLSYKGDSISSYLFMHPGSVKWSQK